MRNLIQQPWWYGAIQDQVAVEKLDLLDRLPSSDWGRSWSRLRGIVLISVIRLWFGILWLSLRIGTKRIIGLDDWPPIIVIVIWLMIVRM